MKTSRQKRLLCSLPCPSVGTSSHPNGLRTLTQAFEDTATLESVTVFAGPSHAYEAVTKGFVRVYSEYPPTHFSLAVYQKRLDVHLRALKTLFIDLLAASRPHGDYGLPSRDSRSGKYGKGVGAKGKEKEGDVKMSDEVEAEESIEALTQRVSSIVYDLGPASTTSTAYPGPSGFSSVPSTSRLSPTLDALLELLDDASRPDHPGSRLSGTSQRMRIADHVCALLSRTIQGYQERQSIAAGGKGKQTLAALRRLVEVGSEKVSWTRACLEMRKKLTDECPGPRSRKECSTR